MCRSQITLKSNKQLKINTGTFPYPDPSKVKGNPGFVSQLAELAQLEAETIWSEQAKARLMSARSRPTSARSLKSSVSFSAVSSRSSYQPNCRTSLNAGTSRVPSMIKRINSTPAVGAYTHRGGGRGGTPSVVNSFSYSELQTQSRKANSFCPRIR